MNRKFNTVKLSQVTLQDAYCVNALEKEIAYLLEFDPDRLLAGFRETAGIDMRGAVRYQGWESFLIGGHTLGHYLTACAQGYAGGNISDEQRDGLYKMITTLIDGLKECQDNTKGKPGYIFVDIFDFISFDLSRPQGAIVTTLNGKPAQFMEELHEGDVVEVYWKTI